MKKSVFREKYNNEEIEEYDIVIYTERLYMIGGIESWTYYVCKKYNVGQITVMYKHGDLQQLERLEPVVKTVQYTGQNFKCRKIIFPAPVWVTKDLCDRAEKKYLVNHCNYGNPDNTEVFELPELDGIYAVSDVCKDSCKRRMIGNIVTLYNPVEIEVPDKVLKLISATRWHKRKGNEQMLKFAEMLEKAQIKFMWFIFTDVIPEKHHPNMFFMPPRMELASIMKECDYGVQFTCDESYGLFPVECLLCGTPVIVTDLPVFREIGINESNAFFYDLDMNGRDVKELLNIPKVKYKLPDSSKIYEELMK